ncbi:amidase [Oleispirillum naphthae]|uniref:amidase n=1 Tax=Oleispirillum naphthae TaxID=2838853 RepID=UPI003082360C
MTALSADIQAFCRRPAAEILADIRSGRVSARETMEAHLACIAAWNPAVNAIVTLVAEDALRAAAAADAAQARGEPLGPLHGLPVAHKDSFSTKGLRTTFGSRVFADNVPACDSIVVERQRRAGAVTVGKTNLPEFGAGSQTFNALFGATRNPYDLGKTPGGSSGGSAAALACGMVALADGSDMGGSLRNPASFCNVVGLRPAVGRVPQWPAADPFGGLTVAGPMGRTVTDVALLLSVLAGEDPRDPVSLPGDGAAFAQSLERGFRGCRIAFSEDLGLPVAADVRAATRACVPVFEDIGCIVEAATPDFRGAAESFQALRGLAFASGYGGLLPRCRGVLKDTVVWNIEYGQTLTGSDVAAAGLARAALVQRMRSFMETHEFLVAPVSQVAPFPVEEEYIRNIEGVDMPTYIDWMRSAFYISLSGHPAISVPFGFTPEGLPVGIQIVGRHRDEIGVLRLAYAVERAVGAWRAAPRLPPEEREAR